MVRKKILPGVSLAALLGWSTIATATDPVPVKSGFSGGAADSSGTASLIGKGTPAAAARAADTEPTWFPGYRRGYYRGFYAGLGYPYGVALPYEISYPYAVSYYTPTYVTPTYVSPTYVTPSYISPTYISPTYIPPLVGFYGRFGRFAVGVGVNGGFVDVAAPAIPLTVTGSPRPVVPVPVQSDPQTLPAPGGIYDGGPAIPVPMQMPKQDPRGLSGQTSPALPAPGLPVSLPKTPPATTTKPYAYKGYGEK